VCQGKRSTGGYSIEMIKITENENTLEVFVKNVSPGPGCGLTQAVTCPFHIIKVPKMDKEVIFTVNHDFTRRVRNSDFYSYIL